MANSTSPQKQQKPRRRDVGKEKSSKEVAPQLPQEAVDWLKTRWDKR